METFKKMENFLEKIVGKHTKNEKQSHNSKNFENGDRLSFLELMLQYIKKLGRGALWRQGKFRNKSHSAEKVSKREPYRLVGFCILR